MPTNRELNNIHIAVASGSIQHRRYLQNMVQGIGLKIVINEPLSEEFFRKLGSTLPDVVLLDIDENTHNDSGLLDRLLDDVDIPVIFNDISALTHNRQGEQSRWYAKLLLKIAELTGRPEWEALDVSKVLADTLSGKEVKVRTSNISQDLARNVWLLGASLGGPEMLKKFLMAVPEDLPVAFILAQHLGKNFMALLAEQLNRMTSFSVMPAEEGHVLCHQQVVVVPVDQRLTVNPIGALELQAIDIPVRYSPSIDMAASDISMRYKSKAGMIVFSGMGDDATRGAKKMREVGGQVWAQDARSCVSSAMPDNLRLRRLVNVSATPVEMAKMLSTYYSSERSKDD
ncbi:Chemotaxis response regulator protein-glutamate methylesterase CheB [hydrothermal vent metagenome]|uniref:protein-glutamate methylesterase n=1 Tax=hydrothermal vent metagenome TaxID=652676 RepID=A0A3B1B806_9ZZZZ